MLNSSPEFNLLRYCVPLNPTTDYSKQARNIIEKGSIDWDRFIKLAFLHQVAPLLYQPLKQRYRSWVPQEILDAFDVYYQKHSRKNESLTQELLNILQALAEQNITAVPFKGPLLAQQLYGDIALRSFRDLDFLTKQTDIPAVMEVLESKGYKMRYELTPKQKKAFWQYSGQDIFHHRDGTASVEPHWAFSPSTLAIEIDYPALFQRTTHTVLKGVSTKSFAPEDTIIILCIHGSKELWERLKWICDIAEFINTYPEIDWPVVLTRAKQQGCLRMVYLGLLLTHRIFDIELHKTIRQSLQRDSVTEKLVQQICIRLIAETVQNNDVYQLNTIHWQMRERNRDRWHYLWRTLTTPRERHFRLVNLPDTLYWGYYPVKLTYDYGLEPGWNLLRPMIRRQK